MRIQCGERLHRGHCTPAFLIGQRAKGGQTRSARTEELQVPEQVDLVASNRTAHGETEEIRARTAFLGFQRTPGSQGRVVVVVVKTPMQLVGT